MKRHHLGTSVVGAVLLAYALFAYGTGGIAGRSGSIAVTRARDPIVFWAMLAVFTLCGAFALLYGLAKIFNRAIWFTARVDSIVSKSVLPNRSDN